MQFLRSTWATLVFVVGLLATCQRDELFASGAHNSGGHRQHPGSRFPPALSRPFGYPSGRPGSDPNNYYGQPVAQPVPADDSGSVASGELQADEPVYGNVLRFRKPTEIPRDSESSSSGEDDSEEEEREQPVRVKSKNVPRPLPRPRSSVNFNNRGFTNGTGGAFESTRRVEHSVGLPKTYVSRRRSHDASGSTDNSGNPTGTGERRVYGTHYENGNSLGMTGRDAEPHADADHGTGSDVVPVPATYVSYLGGPQGGHPHVRGDFGNARGGARMRKRVTSTHQDAGNGVSTPEVVYATKLGSGGRNFGKSMSDAQNEQPTTRFEGPEDVIYAELEFPTGGPKYHSEAPHFYETVDDWYPRGWPLRVPRGDEERLFGAAGAAGHRQRRLPLSPEDSTRIYDVAGPAFFVREPANHPHDEENQVFAVPNYADTQKQPRQMPPDNSSFRPLLEDEAGYNEYEEIPRHQEGSVQSGSSPNISESGSSDQSERSSVGQRIRKVLQRLRMKL